LVVAYVVLLAPPPKAAVEATLTTAPLLAFSAGAAARTQRKGPTRFTLSSLVQKASYWLSRSEAGMAERVPGVAALFTR
jgi:hypothetical protein